MQGINHSELFESYSKNSILLTTAIINDYEAKNQRLIYANGFVYKFNGRCYDALNDKQIDGILHTFIRTNGLDRLWKGGRINDVKRALPHQVDQVSSDMDAYQDKICVANGVLEFNTDGITILHHSSKLYFSTYVMVDYDPLAPSPVKFTNFLSSLFINEQGTVDHEAVSSLIELGGLLIFPPVKVKKMFIFVGEGANGKSILLNLYKRFFPAEAVTSLSLQAMSSEGHVRSDIVRSRLNLTAEAKSNAVDSEEIKKIISGEGITINPKHAQPFTYYPHTKIIAATNTRPYFNDTTYAIFRRLVFYEFKNRFMELEEYNKVDKPQDNRIFKARDQDELEAELCGELSGILNLFIDALLSLKDNNWQITESDNSKEAKGEYKVLADPVGTWLRDNYEPETFFNDGEHAIAIKDLYNLYDIYYSKELQPGKYLNLGVKSFSHKVKEVFRLEPKAYYKNKEKVKCYQLKEKQEDDNQLDTTDGSECRVGSIQTDLLAEITG